MLASLRLRTSYASASGSSKSTARTRRWYAAIPVLLLVVQTGCGSGDPQVMPDVGARQLDIALSDIKRAGFEDEVEVVGGGTFGVLNESAWTVCQQEPAPGKTIDSPPRLIVDRTCEDEAPPDENSGEAEPEADPTPESSKTPNNKPKANRSQAEVETFVMPALVGATLQDAQDMLQALGSYLLTQTDATGLGRFQVLDSGWKVCGQRPAVGAKVPIDKLVELLAVKLDERCP